ncbi:MAG: hypothetical protein HYU28_08125 [Actinobacteria bacterium]|nr:hypothetical protein [Actinomycetota bacterium]
MADRASNEAAKQAKDADAAAKRAGRAATEELPDVGLFWRWAGQATRPVAGWILIALGAIAIVVGYLGVSREALVAKQIPYLVSGGIGGMVLVAVGAFFLGTEDLRRQLLRLDRIEEQVDELHAVLLSRRDAPTRGGNGASGSTVALAGGSTYHRSSCQMVTGKHGVEEVNARAISRRNLEPCGICEPQPVKAG